MFSDFDYKKDQSYRIMAGFVERIPQDVLADASNNCNAYTRALMHREQYIKNKQEDLHTHMDFLQVRERRIDGYC